MEREVGGAIGMGNTCKPMADSFQCLTKPTTIKKNLKKKKKLVPLGYFSSFPGGSVGKESAYNAGDLGSIPESGRSP